MNLRSAKETAHSGGMNQEVQMKERILGGSGLAVTPVGLGCMGLSHASGAPTEKREAVRILRQAHDMGYTLFDTAECYTGINADGRFPITKNWWARPCGLSEIRWSSPPNAA